MRRWIAFAPLAALTTLALLFVGSSLRRDPHYAPAALVGQPLPADALSPLAGGPARPIRVDAPPGSLVNFFASWCAPCREEHPVLLALKAQGVRIVGVAYKDNPAHIKTLLAENGDPYAAVLADPDGRAGLDFGVSGVPETFLVGPGGRIVAKVALPLTPDSAAALLAHDGGPR
ncbi:MAG TPA: DsbE family thiol:disulfide interchange protein [Caulobacteraceae bacterium]|jgi:cytochrome c biogenesis protein CcmG/thiol:disulfide interchange protein DsbE|nr:DsbE family thiol:disulfide interchange protein [Caulobacteraceae bacterium]